MKPVQIRHITAGQLSDSNEAVKEHFRRFLDENWDPENYEYWIQECLRNNYNRELQDIIVSLGGKLGFNVEYGRYAGKHGEIGADGIWQRPSGELIVVEVKAATWPGPDVSQLAGYMSLLAEQRSYDTSSIYGLYVIGDQNSGSLVAQIKGSHPKEMRVIRYEDLLKLYQLRLELDEVGEHGAEKIQRILLPVENVDVGDLIGLILEIAEFKKAGAQVGAEADEIEVDGSDDAWTPSELKKYLDESTGIQRALFAVLSRAMSGGWVEKKHVIAELPDLLRRIGDKHAESVGKMTLAGAQAGLTMRRNAMRKPPVVIVAPDGQRLSLAEEYVARVREWLKTQGLSESVA